MNIALFGASGATGRLLLQRCFAGGHNVTALVRSPEPFRTLLTRSGLPIESTDSGRPSIHIVSGNAFDPEAVRQTVQGADVVFSALGARSLKKEDVLERAVPLIISAMQETASQPRSLRRIIVLGAAGALPAALDKQPAWRRWVFQNVVYNTILKWPIASQISQWQNLSRSDLDWTMVMPPMLTNTPGHGSFRIDGEALPRNGSRISREDVADFLMQQIDSPQWIRKGVYITW
jgi:putative NADH-flavin reductase